MALNILVITDAKNVALRVGPTREVAFDIFASICEALGQPLRFAGEKKVQCNPIFVKTSLMMEGLRKFCDGYKSKELWQFYSFINKIREGRRFILVICEEGYVPDQIDMMNLKFQLVALNTGRDFKEVQNDFLTYSKDIMKYYDVIACYHAGEDRVRIGHFNPNERRCRFCGKDVADGAMFGKKAHAISELTGNKSLVLNDECDDCNGGPISKLEVSLAAYLEALRVLLGIHGKKSIPEHKEANLKIENLDGKRPEVRILSALQNVLQVENGGLKMSFPIESGKYVPQDVYRILAKFCISVISDADFNRSQFKSLCEWILRRNDFDGKLPLVAIRIEGNKNPQYPQITVYRRKKGVEGSVPLYLCDLFAVAMRFMFELPYVEEHPTLIKREDWENLFKMIPTFCGHIKWGFEDFSEAKEIRLRTNIVLEAKKQMTEAMKAGAAHPENTITSVEG